MSPAPKVVFCSTSFPRSRELLRERLSGTGIEIGVADPARPIEREVRDAGALVPAMVPITASIMEAAPGLRLIVQFGSGIEGIDLEAAAARGIAVRNAPGANAQSVAETALFLMLALARKLPLHRRSFEARTMGEPVGSELLGKTLGIVGLGHSGGRLAVLARGIGMEVIGIRRRPAPHAQASWVGGPRDLDALLRRSDYVSLHAPLSEETRGLIDARALACLKPSAYLVNVGRGGLIDRAALEAALRDRRIAGAGLDVHWEEPSDPSDPLLAMDNVVATPHIGGMSEEFLEVAADRVAALLREFLLSAGKT